MLAKSVPLTGAVTQRPQDLASSRAGPQQNELGLNKRPILYPKHSKYLGYLDTLGWAWPLVGFLQVPVAGEPQSRSSFPGGLLWSPATFSLKTLFFFFFFLSPSILPICILIMLNKCPVSSKMAGRLPRTSTPSLRSSLCLSTR